MKNEIMVFENSEFGRIRTVMIDNNPWFVAKDVCTVLDLVNPNKAISDLKQNYMAVGVNYVDIISSYPLMTLGGVQQMTMIAEQALYDLVLQSRKLSSMKFRFWVTSEVLPAIRKTGSYSSAETILKKVPFMEFDKHSLSVVFDLLKPSENSKLMMVHKLFDKHGADKNLLPQFTEKVKPIFSATKLLEDFGKPMSVRDFNKKMREKGFLELKTRKSRKDGASDKTFLALTSTGLGYGQNDVSPQNPLETQPHYYEETFDELLSILAARNN